MPLLRGPRTGALVGALIGGLTFPGAAIASADDGKPSAAAEALFQEGRALLMAGKAAEACPKLEESHRLDPATGTLLALALCREQQGKLASAWAAFLETEGRARQDGRADRERLAREHAAALAPRLSTLTLRVPPDLASVPGLNISVDGVTLGRGAWNVDIPIDGGAHTVAADVEGGRAWSAAVTIEREGEHARIDVRRPVVPIGASVSQDAPPAAPPPGAPAALAPASRSDSRPANGDTGRPLRDVPRIAGIVVTAAGALALGAAIFVAVDAKRDYDRAVVDCRDKACPPPQFAEVADARRRGDVATVVALIGGVAIASGAVLWMLAPPPGDATRTTASGPRVDRVGITAGGATIAGRF